MARKILVTSVGHFKLISIHFMQSRANFSVFFSFLPLFPQFKHRLLPVKTVLIEIISLCKLKLKLSVLSKSGLGEKYSKSIGGIYLSL